MTDLRARALRRTLEVDSPADIPWPDIAPSQVNLAGVVPTQWPHYVPCRVCQHTLGRPADGGDLPRFILADGVHYIWDGHNRIARLLKAGAAAVTGRVWPLPEPEATP